MSCSGCIEKGSKIVRGLLLTCEGPNPLLIPIPITHGDGPPCELNHVNVSRWLATDDHCVCLVDNVASDREEPLSSNFLIYTHRQMLFDPSICVNEQISSSLDTPWFGDILILKIRNDLVTDVKPEDVNRIKEVVVWLAHYCFHSLELVANSAIGG